MSLLTLGDVAKAIAAAEAVYSRFGWHTTRTALPNASGYRLDITDDHTATIWVDGTLDVAGGFTALVTAIDELLDTVENVIPLHRPLAALQRMQVLALES